MDNYASAVEILHIEDALCGRLVIVGASLAGPTTGLCLLLLRINQLVKSNTSGTLHVHVAPAIAGIDGRRLNAGSAGILIVSLRLAMICKRLESYYQELGNT